MFDRIPVCEKPGSEGNQLERNSDRMKRTFLMLWVFFLVDTHYKSTPNLSDVSTKLVDLICDGISINSSYATRVLVRYRL